MSGPLLPYDSDDVGDVDLDEITGPVVDLPDGDDFNIDWSNAEVTYEPAESVDNEPFRIGEMLMETNNATHIQQFALALVDAGFQIHIEAQEDGFWVRVFWNDQIVE